MVENLKQLMRDFSSEEHCREFLIRQRWNGKPQCPYCGCDKSYKIENGKRFKCGNKECYKKYSVTVGTVFHASNIPLTIWFPAMYIITAHKKGISSIQLAKDLGVTQKTAWFMNHRIRESLKDKNSTLLGGTVEVDETYMSRKIGSEYKGIPEGEFKKDGRTTAIKSKGAVMGFAERNGKIKVKVFNEIDSKIAQNEINQTVQAGSKLYTDQSGLYRSGLDNYERETIRHSKPNPEFARGDVHVNTIESFWGLMKRGIVGIYHHISYKHLQAYCDEFAYRRNTRDLKDGMRFELSLSHIEGKLPYKQLVHGKGNQSSKA